LAWHLLQGVLQEPIIPIGEMEDSIPVPDHTPHPPSLIKIEPNRRLSIHGSRKIDMRRPLTRIVYGLTLIANH
jgi:hypothetical protein